MLKMDRLTKPLKPFYWLSKEPNGSAETRELSFSWINSDEISSHRLSWRLIWYHEMIGGQQPQSHSSHSAVSFVFNHRLKLWQEPIACHGAL